MADELARQRREQGVSLAAQARRLGIATGTLRSFLDGRDVSLAVLRRIMAATRHASPPDALGGHGRAACAPRSAFIAQARWSGRARRLTRRLVQDVDGTMVSSLVLEGLTAAGAGELRTALALHRVLLPASPLVTDRLTAMVAEALRSGSARAADGRETLTLEHSRDRGWSLSHEWAWPSQSEPLADLHSSRALTGGWTLSVPVTCDRAELSVDVPELEPVAAPWAWPSLTIPADAEGDSLPWLHPRDAWSFERRGSRVVLKLRHVLPGITYGIVAASPKEVAAGSPLRASRVAAGWTTRELGKRAGISAAAVSKAELGGDLKLSTARRLVRVLPTLSPWSILTPGKLSAHDRWQLGVDVAGVIATEEWKVVTLGEDGSATIDIGTEGLKRLRGKGDLRIRLGHEVPKGAGAQARLFEVRAASREGRSVRITTLVSRAGDRLAMLTIPASMLSAGAAHSRRLMQDPGVFTMTRERAISKDASLRDVPLHEGTSFTPLIPCERARLELRWPRRWQPMGLRAHAFATWMPPDIEASAAEAGVEHPEIELRRRSAVLTVTRPLPGVKIALSWEIP